MKFDPNEINRINIIVRDELTNLSHYNKPVIKNSLKRFHESAVALYKGVKIVDNKNALRIGHTEIDLVDKVIGLPFILPTGIKRGVLLTLEFDQFADNYFSSYVKDKSSKEPKQKTNEEIALTDLTSLPAIISSGQYDLGTKEGANGLKQLLVSTIHNYFIDGESNRKFLNNPDLTFHPLVIFNDGNDHIAIPNFSAGDGSFNYMEFMNQPGLDTPFAERFVNDFCSFASLSNTPPETQPEAPEPVLDTSVPNYEPEESKDVVVALNVNGQQINLQSSNIEQLSKLIKLLV